MSTSGAAPAPILTEAELKLLQALVYQECGMHFDERRTHFLQDRLLRRLRECRADSFYAYYRLLISQQGKDELAKLLPARETVVEIDLNDGTHLSERVSAVRGTPRNPMNRDEVIGKARDLIVPVLGRDTATRLTDTIFDIESLTDIRILRRLLQRG